MIAVWHLFLAAKVLPAPENTISWFALTTILRGAQATSGIVLSLFFAAALTVGTYEHFVHAGRNNVFMVAPGEWKTIFQLSVAILTFLEIAEFWIGCRSLRDKSPLTAMTTAR